VQFASRVDEYENPAAGRNNFLIREFFLKFLDGAKQTIDSLVAETRGRYAAPIVAILAQDNSLQKRYPLEAERDFTILIPLRNPGGAVAELVGIEGGVVSGVINLESSGVEASDWRPRHDEPYHEA
jgi:hypothetical protein